MKIWDTPRAGEKMWEKTLNLEKKIQEQKDKSEIHRVDGKNERNKHSKMQWWQFHCEMPTFLPWFPRCSSCCANTGHPTLGRWESWTVQPGPSDFHRNLIFFSLVNITARNSIHQSIKRSTTATNQSINRSITSAINQSINRSVIQSVSQSVNQSINPWTEWILFHIQHAGKYYKIKKTLTGLERIAIFSGPWRDAVAPVIALARHHALVNLCQRESISGRWCAVFIAHPAVLTRRTVAHAWSPRTRYGSTSIRSWKWDEFACNNQCSQSTSAINQSINN